MKLDLNILEKYHQGTCTMEELEALKQYFLADNLEELQAILAKEWKEAEHSSQPTNQALKADIWAHIQKQGFQKKDAKIILLNGKANNRRLKWGIAIAASIIGLILLTTWIIYIPIQQQQWVEKENTSNEVQRIILADGSTVWLNRSSKIIYPKNFTGNIRSVTLEGEAYFDVVKDPEKPFIVIADNVQTKVLGTSFNVKAFLNRHTIEVALVEGKVNVGLQQETLVQSVDTLTPGELFAYNKLDNSFATDSFDNDAPYAWRQDIIHFQRANVQEVAQTLQDWYDIKITIEQDSLIEGTLIYRYDTKKLTLKQVLDGISLVSNYRFRQVAKDQYLIIPK